MQSSYLHVHERDNVIVTLKGFEAGESISHGTVTVTLNQKVPVGHKVALRPIKQGENIIKYGFPIGRAKEKVEAGDWIHTHNVQTNLEGTLEYTYTPKPSAIQAEKKERTFMGYLRDNGEAAIRNEVWIIPTVGCINKTAELLAKMANEQYSDKSFDGVYHYPHLFGCSQLGDDLHNTQKNIKQPSASP